MNKRTGDRRCRQKERSAESSLQRNLDSSLVFAEEKERKRESTERAKSGGKRELTVLCISFKWMGASHGGVGAPHRC